MELRNQSLNPDNVGLSPGDFITGPAAGIQQPNPFPKPSPTGIPDLHKVDLNSTPQARQEILQKTEMSTSELKQEILDEKISQDIKTARESSLNKAFPDSPKDILKQLIAHGEYQEVVEIFGSKWTMRALDQRDLLLAAEMVKDDLSSSTARMSSIIFLQVVFSLEAINGTSIYDCFQDIKPADYKTREEYSLAIRVTLKKYLEHVPPQVINMFYDEYKRIEDTRNKALGNLKNS
jgi:hypothetical protein